MDELLPDKKTKKEDLQKAFVAKEENRIGVERLGKFLNEEISATLSEGHEILIEVSKNLKELASNYFNK